MGNDEARPVQVYDRPTLLNFQVLRFTAPSPRVARMLEISIYMSWTEGWDSSSFLACRWIVLMALMLTSHLDLVCRNGRSHIPVREQNGVHSHDADMGIPGAREGVRSPVSGFIVGQNQLWRRCHRRGPRHRRVARCTPQFLGMLGSDRIRSRELRGLRAHSWNVDCCRNLARAREFPRRRNGSSAGEMEGSLREGRRIRRDQLQQVSRISL